MREIQINNHRLNGYRPSHRNRWVLINSGILKPQEFLLFEYYLDIMDFDPSHTNTYGTFTYCPKEISLIFGRKKPAINSWHRTLLQSDLICSTSTKNIYEIPNANRYITPGKWQGQAGEYARQEKHMSHQEIIDSLKRNTNIDYKNTKNNRKIVNPHQIKTDASESCPSKALVSSKDESNYCSDLSQSILDPSDIQWINDHVPS